MEGTFRFGDGTLNNPFQIEDAQDFNAIRNNLTANYIQVNDIDLSKYKEGTGFIPVGNTITPFKGTYDGKNFEIRGLVINDEELENAGLFGCIEAPSSAIDIAITGIKLVSPVVTAKKNVGLIVGLINENTIVQKSKVTNGKINCVEQNAGLIAGTSKGTLINCIVSGTINNNGNMAVGNIGGLVGIIDSGKDLKYSNANIIINSDSPNAVNIGGLVGLFKGLDHYQPNITRNYAVGNINTIASYIGGLIGRIEAFDYILINGSNSFVEKEYAFNYSNIKISGKNYIGGLIGLINNPAKNIVLENSYSMGSINATGDYVGGIVGGSLDGVHGGKIDKCYTTMSLKAKSIVGGIAGFKNGNIFNSFVFSKEFIVETAVKVGRVSAHETDANNGLSMLNIFASNKLILKANEIEIPFPAFYDDILHKDGDSLVIELFRRRRIYLDRGFEFNEANWIMEQDESLPYFKTVMITAEELLGSHTIKVIDFNKKAHEVELYLATPQRKIVQPINGAKNISLETTIGEVNTLSFEVLYDIEKLVNNQLVVDRNEVIDKMMNRFLIKLVYGDYVEWFIITKMNDKMTEGDDTRSVNCFSLPYEMKNTIITSYSVISYKLKEILKGKRGEKLKGILTNSIWGVGYIDDDIEVKYRTYETTSKTGLESILELAQTFDAVPIFDTVNRLIHFYSIYNIGKNRGLVFDYGKYLKTMDKEQDTEEFATRLKIYGREGLSIRRVNPVGTDYIEDYSFFLYPFTQDKACNVLTHSNYMSDNLCKAILKYQDLVNSKTGEFNTLLTRYDLLQQLYIAKSSELRVLQDKLTVDNDSLDVAKRNNGGGAITFFQQEVENIQKKIDIQNVQVTDIGQQMIALDTQIADLKKLLSEESNFTPELLYEKMIFTVEKEYIKDDIGDENELFKSAVDYFREIKQPKTVMTIDVSNFKAMVEEQLNWDKLVLGDKALVVYDKFNTKTEVRMMKIGYNFEAGDIGITVSSTRDFTRARDKIINMLYKNIAMSKTVQVSKVKWNGIDETKKTLSEILNNPWETLKLEDSFKNSDLLDINRIYDEIEQRGFQLDMSKIDDLIKDKLDDIDVTKQENINEIVNVTQQQVINVETAHILNAWIKNLFVDYLETNQFGKDVRNPFVGTERNYVSIKDQHMKFISQDLDLDHIEYMTVDNPNSLIPGTVYVYYTAIGTHPDAYKYFTITPPSSIHKEILPNSVEEQAFRVQVFKKINELVKLEIKFKDDGSNDPIMVWGTGTNPANPNSTESRGYIEKFNDSLAYNSGMDMYYFNQINELRRIRLSNRGITVSIQNAPSGFKQVRNIFTSASDPIGNTDANDAEIGDMWFTYA